MADDKTDITKSLDKLNEELKAFKNVNNTIEEISGNSKENEKIEDREFQLKILEYQRDYDTLNSVLTVIIAVGFSLAIAIIAIAYTSIGQPLRVYLAYTTIGAVAISALSTGVLVYFHKCIFPKSLQDIRDKFLKEKTQNKNSK